MKYSEFPNGWAGPVAAYERFLLAAGCTPKTAALRRDWLARFARWVQVEPFSVEPTSVIDWSASQSWSQATRRSAHQTVKGFYAWAKSSGEITDVPKIPSVRKTPAAPHPASDAALQACLLARDWRVRLAARISVETGLRRAEVACINVDRDLIETPEGTALIVHGKGNKTRIVPLPAAIAGELQRFNGFVFPGKEDGHISAAWLGKLISREMPAGVSMHSLRHRFTTRAYRATRDLVAVQRILEHASPETTLVYLQLADDTLRRVVEAAA